MTFAPFACVASTATEPARQDAWVAPLDGGTAIRITDTVADEGSVRLSPDGRWLAYDSNESGGFEVYVQSFPLPGSKRQVSAGGGRTPRWNADGTELYYLTPDGAVMVVPLEPAGGAIRFGAPTRLFDADVAFTGVGQVFSVASDGRFLLNVVPADRAPPAIVVLQNRLTGL